MGVAEEESKKPIEDEEKNHYVDVAIENEKAPTTSVEPATSWFTAKRLLVVFCVINLITYLDRGVIASTGVNGTPRSCDQNGVCSRGTGVQGDFNLTNAKDGVLSSAFMIGLLVASPIFASYAKSVDPYTLIGVGLSVWTFAAVGCGLSIDFWTITICRTLVGVGEASFISLAAPFIDDNAPPSRRAAWLGIFYACIPTGVALGYVYGGLVGNSLGWRAAFFGEAIMMLPFCIMGFVMKPLQMKGFSPAEARKSSTHGTDVAKDKDVPGSSKEELTDRSSKKPSGSTGADTLNQLSRFGEDMKTLLLDKIYVISVLGYCAYNFVIGAYVYWGPKAGYSIYQMTNSDMVFGGTTIIAGIVGTFAGGLVLDSVKSTIPNAFKVLSAAALMGAVFCFSAFCLKNMYAFIIFLLIGETLLFATLGPSSFVCLHTVVPSLRPLSMAMCTVATHIFGDVPSAPLVGLVQDKINNWRTTALLLSSILFLACGIWTIGIFVPSVDRYYLDSEDQVVETDQSNIASTSTDQTNIASSSEAKTAETTKASSTEP